MGKSNNKMVKNSDKYFSNIKESNNTRKRKKSEFYRKNK